MFRHCNGEPVFYAAHYGPIYFQTPAPSRFPACVPADSPAVSPLPPADFEAPSASRSRWQGQGPSVAVVALLLSPRFLPKVVHTSPTVFPVAVITTLFGPSV